MDIIDDKKTIQLNRAGRIQFLINNNWKFMHGDIPEAKETEYDDSTWYDIGIPHSFGIPYFMESEFYVGYGCYRRTLHIDSNWEDKRLYLEFQGSFQETEVYVNGLFTGVHKGGYTAFCIDITSYTKIGENQLFIRVNNLWNPRLAPRAGEHVFNGGIYRDISLLVANKVHVAWYGTFITTPEVSDEAATILVQTEIDNTTERVVDCKLESVFIYEEVEVGRISSHKELGRERSELIEQSQILNCPILWHPDSPHLYKVLTYLYIDNQLVDSCETEFGIRWFSFTEDKGFFLNGSHYQIHGANVHQDHAGWSDAVTHAGIQRDIALIKGCGMNFIRGSHYPHHTYFAEECDKQGILFWSENCFWGTGGPKEEGYWTASGYPVNIEDEEEFEESCKRTLREMIRTNRNHPSIIVWSMCNEPFFSNIEVMDKAKSLVKKLVELSRQLDSTRPAAVGGVQRGGFDKLGDLAGYNGDGAVLFHNPGVPNFVSEYGSKVSDRPGEFSHRYLDGVEIDYPWRSGKALWCAFHHGSILYDMGHMGIIDYYRLPLRDWFWYRENLLGIPYIDTSVEGIPSRIKLTADRKQMTCNGTEDVYLIVEIVDKSGNRVLNAPEILLEVMSGHGIMPTGKTFILSEDKGNFIDGLGAIELRAYYGGNTIVRASGEGLESVELCIEVLGEKPQDERKLKQLQPPPYVMGPPIRKELYNIGIHRPVFCSSAETEHPAENVTDGESSSFWRPTDQDEERWILVDLEGTKEIKKVMLALHGVVNTVYEIALTNDRKEFRDIYISQKGDANDYITVSLKNEKARYVRVKFPDNIEGVREVTIMD